MNLTTAQTKSGTVNFLNQITFNGGSGGGTAIICNNGLGVGTFLNVGGQATFNNFTPICSVAIPTAVNHLTRKDYIDTNFAGLTTTNSFSGVNTFTTNTNFSSSITFKDIANFSTIQQSSAVLNIENPTLSSTIRLKTRASTGAVQNSLTLNTASCDVLSPTLNLTSTTPTSILTPNNLNGTINLFNNLTTGGTLNIGSTSGVNVINGNTEISNTLTVNEPSTFLDYIIINTGLKWVDVASSANYVESRVLGTALGFIPSFNLNSYEFYTNNSSGTPTIPVTITDASTTLNHQLICNNGAVFNTTLPTSTINASSSGDFTIRGFTDATYQTIASMASYLTSSAAALLYQEKIVGSIIQMAVATLPSGYLACDGGSYSSSTYPALSTFLNFTYGGSSGSGMFQVPDFRGMFLRGAGTNGIDSTYVSSTYGSLQTDGIRSHTHGIDFGFLATVSGGGGQNAYNSTSPNYNNPGTGAGRATGITTSNNNPYADTRPGNFCVFYCIKY
jgi:microcystin-dependent protein